MFLELERFERNMLINMVENGIRDIRPQIRRSRNPDFHDELKRDLGTLRSILAKLEETRDLFDEDTELNIKDRELMEGTSPDDHWHQYY